MAKSSAKAVLPRKPDAKLEKPIAKPAPAYGGTDADASLQELFVSELKDMYWAEQHLVKAIPKMIAAAGEAGLKTALTKHLKVTMNHAARLEQAFELLGEDAIPKKCDAMEGLTMGGEHVIENTVGGTPVRDTGIIMSGLKVEQFEIIAYKGLIQVANALGKADVADLLQQNMDEEIEASDKLTELSQNGLSTQA